MDAISRFLERRDGMLLRLEEQLQQTERPIEVAQVLCDYAGRELNLADCVVYLPDNGALVQAAAWGTLRGTETMLESRLRLPIGKGVAGTCASTLQAQRVRDSQRDPSHPGNGCRSELAVAIGHDEILLGVLHSESSEPAFYDARYEAAFLAIADAGAGRLWHLRARRVGES